VCHIDDLLIMSPNLQLVESFKRHIAKTVEITDLGEAHFFLGIEISRDRAKHTITLSQTKYVKEIMSRFNKSNLHAVSTPAELGIRLDKSDKTAEACMVQEYQKQIGSLMYLMTKTRPDIAFAVSCCARFMSNPDATHFRALDRVWKSTIRLSILHRNTDFISAASWIPIGGVITQLESRLLGTYFSTPMLRYHGLAKSRRLWHCLRARLNIWHSRKLSRSLYG
jgi:hypothetical protein